MFVRVEQDQNGNYLTDVDNKPCEFQYYFGTFELGSGGDVLPVFSNKPFPTYEEGTMVEAGGDLLILDSSNPTIISKEDVTWTEDGCGYVIGAEFTYQRSSSSISLSGITPLSVYNLLSPM